MPACARPSVALGACGFTELVCVSVCAQGVTTFGQTASLRGHAGSGQFRASIHSTTDKPTATDERAF